jgi:hypothetical protein
LFWPRQRTEYAGWLSPSDSTARRISTPPVAMANQFCSESIQKCAELKREKGKWSHPAAMTSQIHTNVDSTSRRVEQFHGFHEYIRF